MLNEKYYKNIYGFINYGLIIFDKESRKLEYTNEKLLTYLNTTEEYINFNFCDTLEGIALKKSEITVNKSHKIVFTPLSNNLSNKLLMKGPMVIFTWMNKENWPTTFVSENVEEILGYSVEDFIKGKLLYSDIIHKADLERVSKEVKEAIDEKKEYFHHEPYRLLQKNGQLIWISDFTVVVKNHKGEITGFHGYINNINELMKTRNALIEQEERSKEIIDAAGLGTWEWNYETDKISHNDKWFEMLGYKADNFENTDVNAKISHPGDLKKAWKELRRHINGEKEHYEIERRIKCKDNTYAWILDKGRIIKYGDDNQPKKIFGVHVDISQQKIIEERFKLFMDSAEEIFIILNKDLIIVEINKAALLLISEPVHKAEVIGKKIHQVFPFLDDMINEYKDINSNRSQLKKIEKYRISRKEEFLEFNLFNINNEIGIIGHNVTSTVLYQRSIEQMNDNFNRILSASAFGVVLISLDQKVKWANDQAMKLFGIDDFDEIKGKYCRNFICISNKDRKCPIDGNSNFDTVECKIRNKNNQLIEVMKKATMIDYENEKVVLESFIDISDRKAMERKLEKETERLKNVYRIANIGVFDFDFVNGDFYMNKNQYKIIEVPSEIPNNELIRIIKNRIGYENFDKIRNIPKNGKFSLELELVTPNKKKYVKIYGSTKSKSEKRFHRIIGACIDITDLKEAENKALLASQSKSDFLANMSHEIRTPLNGILGFTEALLETNLNPKQLDYLNTIKYSGVSLTEIIEDILNLSKIEAGKMVLMEEFVDLRQIVSEAIDILKLEAYEKKIKLLYNIDIDESSLVKVDPVRIKQVLINLLGNAIKFTEKGFVKLNIKFNEEKQSLYFEIIDTGIGISPKDQRKIMESFYQGDPQITRKYGGTGLGLTISNRILNLMGSNLNVHSQLGHGSQFFFELKVAIKLNTIEVNKKIDSFVLVIDRDVISGKSLIKKMGGITHQPIVISNLTEAINTLTKFPKIKNIFLSSDYENTMIINLFKSLEKKNRSFHIYLYSFKLYDNNLIQREFENLKYEYISRPMSRRKIREILSESNTVKKGLEKNYIETNRKIKILIAEDNSVNMKLIKTFINSFLSNVEIYEASNGIKVLEILDVQTIDLIFMDIQMPLMDGLETTKKIRSFNNDIPIVGLTALIDVNDESNGKSIGMSDYLRKPISRQKVFDTLKKWIKQ